MIRLNSTQEIMLTVSIAAFALALTAIATYEFGGTGGVTRPTTASTNSAPASSIHSTVSQNSSALPAGCKKPPNGFLIIANQGGFNDSIAHGAPTTPWPVITVKQGSTVDIVVCNTDVQAHGFQVTHYFDSNIETVYPGQVVRVSFVADSKGTFQIYCSIFCSIHIYMQNGQLRVTSS